MAPTYNVANLLRAQAAAQPDAAALSFPAAAYTTHAPCWDTWTFAELDRASDAYAYGFVEAGVQPGDRTLMLVKPSLAFYAVLFGLFKLGAVPVLLDPGMGMRKLLECIERNEPRVVVAMPAVHAVRTFVRRPFRKAELFITAGRRWFWGGLTLAACRRPQEAPFPIRACGPTEDAAILFTSGSTGTAKGVASKHAMFLAQVRALGEMFDFRPGMADVQAFAAFAIFDICLGMHSIIPHMNLSKPASANPADIVAAIRTFSPEVSFGSPIVWQNVSRYGLEHGLTLEGLKILLTVGAPIPAYLHRRFLKLLPAGAQVWTPYGATEALPISWIGTQEILGGCWDQTAAGEGTCVGHLAPGAWATVIAVTEEEIPEWTDDLSLPDGEIGEIVVGGMQVSPEYKNAPAANRSAKIRRGDQILHRMGDLGRFDAQGRLWFCGRKAHRLRTPQGMVPAVPVEGVFNEHPKVFRSALVGVGPQGQEVPVLAVELEPGARWTEALRGELEALAAPTRHAGLVQKFLHHRAFPTDARHNSKIRREDLKVWASKECPEFLSGASNG